eukprot:616298-Alexandrium_andersonii.AAC.1
MTWCVRHGAHASPRTSGLVRTGARSWGIVPRACANGWLGLVHSSVAPAGGGLHTACPQPVSL